MKIPSLSSLLHKAAEAVEDYFGVVHVWSDPKLPVPPDRGELKMVSYNIELGGKHVDEVKADLLKMQPDVVCLQECSPESAQLLGKALGMNVVYQQRIDPHNKVYGKAILSRYPVTDTENVQFGGSFAERQAAKEKLHGEAGEARSILRASIKVGNRTVDVVDTHLSLANTDQNAKEIDALASYSQAREAKGHTVLLAGDFNANLAISSHGTTDPGGSRQTATDTLDEFKQRYPTAVTGNIADARDQAAVDRLKNTLGYYWDAPKRNVVLDGKTVKLEDAVAELARTPVGSPRYQQLAQAVDGISHLTAHKRFDNILASRDVQFEEATIDQTTHASDHQPVSATVRWND